MKIISNLIFSCDYSFEAQNFSHISPNAKDFISKLLVLDAEVNID